MATLKSTFTTLGAVLLAVLMAMLPSPALAEPGVANSEVTYSADGQTFTQIEPDGYAPRSNDGISVRPGGNPNTKTTLIRHSTTNVQHLDVVIAVRDLTELTASRGNPSDFLITIVVDGVESDEYRFGDLFADGEPYDGDPNLRRVGPAIELTGDVGEVHDVKILHRLPAESGNESQRAMFLHNLAVIPQAPSPSPTPTDTETPSPTPTDTETPSPSPTDTETPSPTPTATDTETPPPTPTETEAPAPTAAATESDAPRPSGEPTDQPGPPREDDRPGPPRDDDGKSLPRTGSDVALGLGFGLALVGIGAAAALAGRRRA